MDIGIIMDGLLIVLILSAIGFGLRLEKKLTALREGQAAFGQHVGELNVAAGKAHAALAELRAAGEETDMLHERIIAARQLKADLENLTARGRAVAPRTAPVEPTLDALAAKVAAIQPASHGAAQPASPHAARAASLLQALAERSAQQGGPQPRGNEDGVFARPAAAQPVRRAVPEDDLFEAPRRRA